MALVGKGNNSGWFVGFTLMDNQGDTTHMRYETSATTETEAQVIADGIYAELVLLSSASVVGSSISKELVENNPQYNAGSDVSINAKLTVLLDGGVDKANFRIPSPSESIFVASSGPDNNVVNTTNQNVLDLMAWFGNTAPGNGALISDGETIDRVLTGRRV